jgi:hypothetical protein
MHEVDQVARERPPDGCMVVRTHDEEGGAA